MTIKDEHKVKVQGGKEHVTYAGLLALAHERWGTDWSMEVSVLQYPTDANGQTTIATATVTTPDDRTFTEVGDASPSNVGKMITPHAIRMAATRSKGRALRDALNIGEAMAEELGDHAPQQPQAASRRPAKAEPDPRTTNPPSSDTSDSDETPPDSSEAPLATDAQQDAIVKLCHELKAEGQTDEQAVEAYEESIGFPISLLTESQASARIQKLKRFKARQGR